MSDDEEPAESEGDGGEPTKPSEVSHRETQEAMADYDDMERDVAWASG